MQFQGDQSGVSGTVEVTYLSLKTVYAIQDSYR